MKKFYENFEQYFVASLLAGMTLLAVVNVFVRYVLKGNILWAMEAKIFMFAWLIFFGASWGIRIGAQFSWNSFSRYKMVTTMGAKVNYANWIWTYNF